MTVDEPTKKNTLEILRPRSGDRWGRERSGPLRSAQHFYILQKLAALKVGHVPATCGRTPQLFFHKISKSRAEYELCSAALIRGLPSPSAERQRPLLTFERPASFIRRRSSKLICGNRPKLPREVRSTATAHRAASGRIGANKQISVVETQDGWRGEF